MLVEQGGVDVVASGQQEGDHEDSEDNAYEDKELLKVAGLVFEA